MKYQHFSLLCISISLLLTSGCAPGLGNSLSINSIPVPSQSSSLSGVAADSLVGARVVPLTDARTNTAIAEIDGRSVEPGGDVGNTVRAALENYLRLAGVTPRAFDVPSIGGSVEQWFVTVKPGFPLTEVNARAGVKVEVMDREGHPVFRRSYSGESQTKEPLVNEDRIAAILGDAMASALEEASKDQNLIASIQ